MDHLKVPEEPKIRRSQCDYVLFFELAVMDQMGRGEQPQALLYPGPQHSFNLGCVDNYRPLLGATL